MSAESGNLSGYMGAFHDFVQASSPEELPTRVSQQVVPEPAAGVCSTQSEVLEANQPSSSSAGNVKQGKKRKHKSDTDDSDDKSDDDDEVDSEKTVSNNEDNATSSESDASEPPAVPKRLRAHRTAKQKGLTKMNAHGRGRGLFYNHQP